MNISKNSEIHNFLITRREMDLCMKMKTKIH